MARHHRHPTTAKGWFILAGIDLALIAGIIWVASWN